VKIHPLAAKWPLLEGKEWEEFKAGIKATNGCADNPIFYFVRGAVRYLIDGRHRWRACLELKIKPTLKRKYLDDDQIQDFIDQQNGRRRHLTAEQRKTMIIERREKGESIRTIAEAVGVDPKTVRNELAGAASSGEYSPPDLVIGQNNKVYRGKTEILCNRCQRVGPVKDCPMCKDEREGARKQRDAGSHETRHKSTSGKEIYSRKNWDKYFGGMIREIDAIARAHKKSQSSEHKRGLDLAGDLLTHVNLWLNALAKG
jgi:hypothetical protein